MTNLEISHQLIGAELVVKCAGRLDANQTSHLNDSIDRMVREGYYSIALDMSAIEYISSAGIRALVTQYKNLKAVNGHFYIASLSENVKQVLKMVGMLEMLTLKIKAKEAPTPEPAPAVETPAGIVISGSALTASLLSEKEKTTVSLFGDPSLIMSSAFQEEHARTIHSRENVFALGLGAIGDSFGECKERFGEFILLGKCVAYLPADGTKKPDYMVSSGELVASLNELYGIHFEGKFSHLVRFDPEKTQSTIGLSKLVSGISQLTGLTKFALVMIAESGGMIGASLNAPPVGGKKIFSFPEVKDTVNFTTEPVHSRMLTLSAGYFTAQPVNEDSAFVKQISSGCPFHGHIHSAVYPYTPLKKSAIDLHETIDFLFNSSELTDILHLVNDTRDIVGLGESQFVQGFCWVAPVDSVLTIQK